MRNSMSQWKRLGLVMLDSLIVLLAVAVLAPSALGEEPPWTEGTVTEIQKPAGYQPMGTTPSGVLQGRLSYGYFSTLGQTQQVFVDMRLQDGDVSYGLTGGFPLPSAGASVQPVRYTLYVATPTLQAQWGSDSWAVAATRSISSDVQVRFAAGPTWQAMQVHVAQNGWSAVGSYIFQNGIPSAFISVQSSSTWTWAK